MSRKQLLGLLLVLLLIVTGCGSGNRSSDSSDGEMGNVADPAAPPGYGEEKGNDDGSLGNSEQKLIRTATLSMAVENVEDAIEAIVDAAKRAEGFVAESNLYGPIDNRMARLTLRVPVATLDAIIAAIEATGKLQQSSTGSDDVTRQYVDLEARIRNLERQEERLLDILEQADTVDDILRVEQELARIRGELEARTAEFRYLNDRVDYATIQVSLQETSTASSTITSSGLKGVWQRGIAGLVNSINAMLTGLGSLVVLLFSILPYLFVISLVGMPLYITIRKVMKNRARP
ncbi:MAG: DUF4349 domain-containing protein [Firmicutes bacterium]|nr:DUF4349 domain-containing protein [Bacillota bacterium]